MKIKKFLILPLFVLALSACSNGGDFKEELESKPKDTIEDYLEYVTDNYEITRSECFTKSITNDDELIPNINYLSSGLYLTTDTDNKCTAISLFTGQTLFTDIESTNISVKTNNYTGFNIIIKKEVDSKMKYYMIDSFGNKTTEYDKNITNVSLTNVTISQSTFSGTKRIQKIKLSYNVDDKTYTYLYDNYKLVEEKSKYEVGSTYYYGYHFESDMKEYGYEDSTLVVDMDNNRTNLKITYKEKDKEDKIYTFDMVMGSPVLVGINGIVAGYDIVTKYDDYNIVLGDVDKPIYAKTYIDIINLRKGTIKREYTNIIPQAVRVIDKEHYIVGASVIEKDYEYDKIFVVDEDYDVIDTKINDYGFYKNNYGYYSYQKIGDYYYNDDTDYILDKDANVVTSLNGYQSIDYETGFDAFICENNNDKYGLIGYDGKVLTDFDFESYDNGSYLYTGYIFMQKSDGNWYKVDSTGNQVNLNVDYIEYYYLDKTNNLKTLDGKTLGVVDDIQTFGNSFTYYDENQSVEYNFNGCTAEIYDPAATKYFLNCFKTKVEVK